MLSKVENAKLAKTPERAASQRTIAPAVDIFENRDDILLFADLPGVTNDGLNMHFERGELRIEAQRGVPEAAAAASLSLDAPGYFRSFSLPQGVDADNISAELSNGVLRVRLPKSEAVKPRRIEVKAG